MIFPDRNEIVRIIKDLKTVLFPHHFTEQKYGLPVLKKKLQKQIQTALSAAPGLCAAAAASGSVSAFDDAPSFGRADNKQSDKTDEQNAEKAARITDAFFSSLDRTREKLMLDAQAAFDGDPAAYSIDEVILTYPGFYAIYIYRLAHELYKAGVPYIPRFMSEYAHGKTGIDINPGAQIGEYFCIDHGTGIVIGETAVIGRGVKIYQGVTLGALSTRGGRQLKNMRRHPIVEDNVTVYAGATILGGQTRIGENSVIGGNAFITESVPANSKVYMR